ncbi:UPF0132 domain protein [Kalaharituber pfeilii]|nr:UPF0132 domain protein [Kalaharituber pfeilii]
MDFAPYQSSPPEAVRRSLNLNRPFTPPRSSPSYTPKVTSTPPPILPTHNQSYNPWNNNGRATKMVEHFETSLPLRLDYEAMMAYLLLPPAGGVLLLILEHKSDYVRFHAWQSSLLFTFLVILHFIFSFSPFISYTLLAVDLGLIGYLAMNAYRDADTLDRCEVPFFGSLASSILDDE